MPERLEPWNDFNDDDFRGLPAALRCATFGKKNFQSCDQHSSLRATVRILWLGKNKASAVFLRCDVRCTGAELHVGANPQMLLLFLLRCYMFVVNRASGLAGLRPVRSFTLNFRLAWVLCSAGPMACL